MGVMTENMPNKDPFDSGSDVFSDAVNLVSNMPLSEYFSADELSEGRLETNLSDAKVRDLELWDSDDVLRSNSRLKELIFDIESQQMSCEGYPQFSSGNSSNVVQDVTVTARETETALESLGMSQFRNLEVVNTAKAPTKSSDEVSEFQYSEKVISLLTSKMSMSSDVERKSQKGHQLESSRQPENWPHRDSLLENPSANELDSKEEHDPPNNSIASIHRNKSIVKVISSMQGMFKKREPVLISRDLSPTQIISLTVPRKFLQNDGKSKKNSLRKWRSYMGLNQSKRDMKIHDTSEVKKQLIKTISEGSISMTNCTDDNLIGFCIVPVNNLR